MATSIRDLGTIPGQETMQFGCHSSIHPFIHLFIHPLRHLFLGNVNSNSRHTNTEHSGGLCIRQAPHKQDKQGHLEYTQLTREADGPETRGKHVQDPEAEPQRRRDPGASQPATTDRAAAVSRPRSSEGLKGLISAVHFIRRARDPARCRHSGLLDSREASLRWYAEVRRGGRGDNHGHTGPGGRWWGFKGDLTGLRDRVPARAKGMGRPDESWGGSPLGGMGRQG